jgi:hypothetical protein
MRRFLLVSLVLITAAAALPTIGYSKGSKGGRRSITLSGSLIDTKCFSMDARNQGNDHLTPMGEMKGCGTLCARLGIPVGLLAGKNEVWVLVTPAQDLADHIGQQARVTGTQVYGGHSIRPDKIEVKGASGEWTAINITMPMPMK